MLSAAFYDLEGTLIRTNLVHTLGFFSMNQPGIWRSVAKSLRVVGSIPLFWSADYYSRKVFNDIYFRYYRGESRDRLLYLAEELTFDLDALVRLRGLEDTGTHKIDPKAIRDAYLEEIQEHNHALARQAQALSVDFVPMRTDQPLDAVLASYLAHRSARARGGPR